MSNTKVGLLSSMKATGIMNKAARVVRHGNTCLGKFHDNDAVHWKAGGEGGGGGGAAVVKLLYLLQGSWHGSLA